MRTYKIQDRKAGNVIKTGLTLEHANKMIEEFEQQDRIDGIYEPNFYAIVKEN